MPCAMNTEVVDISTNLVEPNNPYGQVLSSELTVRGPWSSVPPISDSVYEDRDHGTQIQPSDNENLFALFVLKTSGRKPYKGLPQKDVYGVLLTPTTNGTYRRVGVVWHNGIMDKHCKYGFQSLERATVTIV